MDEKHTHTHTQTVDKAKNCLLMILYYFQIEMSRFLPTFQGRNRSGTFDLV